MKKILYIIIAVLLLNPMQLFCANYPLDIINVDEVGNDNRIKYAYPGIEYKVVIAAFGGMYPFNWELLQAPSGMSVNSSTGEITWVTPLIGGTVQVKVTDAEGSVDIESYTVTVTDSTDRFLFVDIANGSSGNTGSIASPYQILDDFWLSNHAGKIVYFRAGTYLHPKNGSYDERHIRRVNIGSDNPIAYLGYPDEAVLLDGEYGEAVQYCFRPDQPDHYFNNITFYNIWFYGMAFVATAHYATVYDCVFRDTHSDDEPHNQASINYMNAGSHENHVIFGNTFTDHHEGIGYRGIETYDVLNSVIQDNVFYDSGASGILIKANNHYIAIRHNIFNGLTERNEGLFIYGGGRGETNIEVSFNLFRNNERLFLQTEQPNPLTDMYIFRNTLNATISFRSEFREEIVNYRVGDFSVHNNVIQNTLSDTGTMPGDFIRDHIDYDNVLQVEYDNLVLGMVDNLVGSSGIIDLSGNLIEPYRTTYLGVAGWETADVTILTLQADFETSSATTSFTFTGTSVDGTTVASVVSNNGTATITSGAGTDSVSGTVSGVSLVSGVNVVQVTLTDSAASTDVKTINITYTPIVPTYTAKVKKAVLKRAILK